MDRKEPVGVNFCITIIKFFKFQKVTLRLLWYYQWSVKSPENSQNLIHVKFEGDVHGLHVGPSWVSKGTDLGSTSSDSSVQKMQDNAPGKAKVEQKVKSLLGGRS